MQLLPVSAPITDEEALGLRENFPLLASARQKALVYLDSAATSQKPAVVLNAERAFYEQRNAAVHRGAHTLAAEATEMFEDARKAVAGFIGASENEVVWTSNATQALNLVAYSMSNASLGRGGEVAARFWLGADDEIVVTEMEHHANLLPWQELAARTGASLRFIPITDDGLLRLELVDSTITERTKVVAFTHVSNVVAAVNPVAVLVARARAMGALVVLDASQSVPHMPVDVSALDVDFAVFSGHKMLGPTGIGVLYGRRELLHALPPFQTGGSTITTVTMESAEYLPPPQKFEAGTQPVAQALGLAAATRYLRNVGMDRIARREHELGQRLVEGLATIRGVRVLGPPPGAARVGLASFTLAGIHSHDVGQFLDDRGIAVRVGHHCAQPLHRRLGITSSTRASAYLYTTTDDIDQLLEALADAARFFGAHS
ncbi:MAG: SufS family cysteine desulfurase [Actinobacteria bacterium]|nr:SufS family cysteine desulfurase [Actinomycetota bacterium]